MALTGSVAAFDGSSATGGMGLATDESTARPEPCSADDRSGSVGSATVVAGEGWRYGGVRSLRVSHGRLDGVFGRRLRGDRGVRRWHHGLRRTRRWRVGRAQLGVVGGRLRRDRVVCRCTTASGVSAGGGSVGVAGAVLAVGAGSAASSGGTPSRPCSKLKRRWRDGPWRVGRWRVVGGGSDGGVSAGGVKSDRLDGRGRAVPSRIGGGSGEVLGRERSPRDRWETRSRLRAAA